MTARRFPPPCERVPDLMKLRDMRAHAVDSDNRDLLLMLAAASTIALDFGTADEARAMLDWAVATLKSDETKVLQEFNDPDNKQFHDRDLYVSCFSLSDGKFIAAPQPC